MSLLLILWLSVLPRNEILIKGATPSASDATTPVPESGAVTSGRYRNAYFEKLDPAFTTHRFNRIPVRVIIDRNGRVKHAHLLSAFPEQSQAILAALKTWKFKPYRANGRAAEVETGIVFGR